MKKKDIIQLVKETVKENTFYGNREQPSTLGSTTAVVPTDEYPFSALPKRTATGYTEQEETDPLTTAEEMYGITAKEEFDEIHLYPGYTPEEKDQVSYRTNKMYIVVEEDLQTVKYVSVQGTVFPELEEMLLKFGFATSGGGSQFSGVTFYRNDSGAKMNPEDVTQLIKYMEDARRGEAQKQSAFYTRQPGTGGTGIDEDSIRINMEQAPPGEGEKEEKKKQGERIR